MKGTLPLGPFDTGMRQPLMIECELEGACVTSARLRYGLGRRGVEMAFEGVTPAEGQYLAARICARSSIAHSLAFCHAAEDAAGVELEEGPAAFRVVLAEYERIASHLEVISDVGRSLEDDIVYHGPRRYLARVREAFTGASGNPFGRGMVVPGGLSVEGSEDAISGLADIRGALRRDSGFWEAKLKLSGARLRSARLPGGSDPGDKRSAPAFRASGDSADLRSGETAYGYYSDLDCRPVTREGGTALDRLLVLTSEIRASLDIIKEAGGKARPPGSPGEFPSGRGTGVGVCESPSGGVEHRVFLGSGGRVIRNRISAQVAAVAEVTGDALSGIRYEDLVPTALSFNLCAACLDL